MIPPHDPYPSRLNRPAAPLQRQDPVVYATDRSAAPLPEAEIDNYRRNGFLILDKLFDEDEIGALRAEAERLREAPELAKREDVIREPDDREVRSVFRPHRLSPLMHRLASDARLLRIARYLLDDEVYLHQARLNFKPGFVGKEFYWHSDFETWHCEDGMPRMRALSVSVSLTPNTEQNGPLLLIPGSHQVFVPCLGATPEQHYKRSLRSQELGVPDPAQVSTLVEQGGIVSATGGAGSVILFDCNTLHGSNGNITPFARTNAFFVYNSVHNRLQQPFAAPRPRPGFLAERGAVTPLRVESGPIRAQAATG